MSSGAPAQGRPTTDRCRATYRGRATDSGGPRGRGGPERGSSRPRQPRHPNDNLWTKIFTIAGEDEENLEPLSTCRNGGSHPVHLNDDFHNGRYRAIHKLGHGGTSTVWLCRDTSSHIPKYVALKVLKACLTRENCRELLAMRLKDDAIDQDPGGERICLPIDQFEIQGPNGTHICIIYPVLGPRLSLATRILSTDEAGTVEEKLQSISKQTTEGLTALHKRGICHGGSYLECPLREFRIILVRFPAG